MTENRRRVRVILLDGVELATVDPDGQSILGIRKRRRGESVWVSPDEAEQMIRDGLARKPGGRGA